MILYVLPNPKRDYTKPKWQTIKTSKTKYAEYHAWLRAFDDDIPKVKRIQF